MLISNPRLLSLIACGLLIGTGTSAAHADHEQRVARPTSRLSKLQKLLDRLPHAQTVVSAAVMSLPDGEMIYERNADRVLIPASNQKIIPGAVALAKLAVGHSFDTRLAVSRFTIEIFVDEIRTGEMGFHNRQHACELRKHEHFMPLCNQFFQMRNQNFQLGGHI